MPLFPSPAGPAQEVLSSCLLTPKVTQAMGCWRGAHAPRASVSSRQCEGSTGRPLRPLAPGPIRPQQSQPVPHWQGQLRAHLAGARMGTRRSSGWTV